MKKALYLLPLIGGFFLGAFLFNLGGTPKNKTPLSQTPISSESSTATEALAPSANRSTRQAQNLADENSFDLSENSLELALSKLPIDPASHQLRSAIFKALLLQKKASLDELISSIAEMPQIQKDQAQQALLATLSEISPQQALEYLKETKLYDQSDSISRIYDQIASQDPDLALQLVEEIGPLSSRQEAYRAIIPHLVQQDYKTIRELSDRIPDPVASYRLVGEMLRHLTLESPEKATQLALTETHASRRQELLEITASSWIDQSPDDFLRHLDTIQDPKQRDLLRRMAAERLAVYDIDRTKTLIDEESDPNIKSALALSAAHILAHENPVEALAWLETFDPQTQQTALPGILAEIADVDPELARGLIDQEVASDKLLPAIQNILSAMAATDPQSALAWSRTLDSPELVEASATQVYQQWAEADLETALAAATAAGDSALRAVTDAWAADDPEKFIDWASTQTGENKKEMYQKGILQLNQIDPLAAIEHYDRLASGSSDERQLSKIATDIAAMLPDAKTAFSWAQERKNPAVRQEALEQVAAQWANEDPASLRRELTKLDSASASTVRAIAASEIVAENPTSALQMAAGIDDARLRLDTLARTYARTVDIEGNQARGILENLLGSNQDEIEQVISTARRYLPEE